MKTAATILCGKPAKGWEGAQMGMGPHTLSNNEIRKKYKSNCSSSSDRYSSVHIAIWQALGGKAVMLHYPGFCETLNKAPPSPLSSNNRMYVKAG